MLATCDSNVVLYLLSGDMRKAEIATRVLAECSVISVQVLNEVTAVLRRKARAEWARIDFVLIDLQANNVIAPLTLETHRRARMYAERYGLTIYEAGIVAAAVIAGCTILWSEDMHDGLVIDGLTIRNPF